MQIHILAIVKASLLSLLISVNALAMEEFVYTPQMRVALWPQRPLREDPMHYARRKNDITEITRETRPSMEIFPAEDKSSDVVLVFPGGGFSTLAYDLEGTEIAHWLNGIGLTAIIVRYTVPGKSTAPFRDSQRAMRMVRKNAAKWGFTSKYIGVMGFSAGGFVVARLSTHWQEQTYDRMDDADDLSARPDFAALIYPAYLNLKKTGRLRKEVEINPHTPPTFIAHTKDDQKYVNGSMLYHIALGKAGVDSQFQLYDVGGHGFGIRSEPELEVSGWIEEFEEWLARRK